MKASSRKIAAAVAARLNSAAPAQFMVRAKGGYVFVYSREAPLIVIGGSASAAIAEDPDDRAFDERIEAAVGAIIHQVQDCISTELRAPWPRSACGERALPKTRRDAEQIFIWFGEDEQVPVIALPPIRLTEVLDT